MQFLRRIKRLVGYTPVPIRHNHVYVDQITGEAVEVTSVGRKVHLIRQDAENRPENRVKKALFRSAIARGVVVHDQNRCPTCRDE
jgi:hypothetical protein